MEYPYIKDVEPSQTSGDDVIMKVTETISLAIVALLSICLVMPLAAEEIASSGGALGAEERLMLKAGSEEVLSLYRHGQGGRLDGGVVLLHDRGTHPDWPGVIQTLRRELPLYGWSTISIELPALGDTSRTSSQVLKAWSESVPARIEAAIVAMGERNIFNLVLIGHGSGAAVAADYIVKNPSDRIQGLIAIGMDGTRVEDESLDGAILLRRLNKRIFDIYGSRDLQSVVSSAKRREMITITAEPGKKPHHLRAADIAGSFNAQSAREITYRQYRLEGADHQFRGYEKQLLGRVVGWLRRYAVSSSIKISR